MLTEAIQAYSSPLEGMYGVGTKNRAVIEHDAKTRLLIERLRGDEEPASYTKVRYWFLTESTSLPTYGRLPIRAAKRPKYPFCILTSTWAQIVRSVVPRTDDLDAVIVGLLASPYVGYKLPISGTPRKAVERVVARIDTLKDVPASVAVAMVGDQAMAAKIGGEVDEAEINRMVEEGLTQKAQELEKRIAESAEEAVAAQRERTKAEKRAREASAVQTASEAERDRAQAEAKEARSREVAAKLEAEKTAAREGELKREIEEAKKRERAAKDREAEERKEREEVEARARKLRNTVAIAVAGLFFAVGAGVLVSGVVEERGWKIAIACFSAIGVYGTLSYISSGIEKKLINIAAILVAVITIATALFPQSDSSEGAKETQEKASSSSSP